MKKEMIGSLVTMMIMAHETGEVGKVVTPTGVKRSLTGVQCGFLVETTGAEGVKCIRVTIVEDGEPLIAELSCDGEVTLIEGTEERFINACEGYTLAW